ncbi:MAG: type II secretion system protein, partial [bacterium]|nr:type II secretion system protein [bacterium]
MFYFLNYKNKGFTPTQENGVVSIVFLVKQSLIDIKNKWLKINNISRRQNKNTSPFFCAGFTLIEVVLYVGVLGILLVAISSLMMGTMD